METIEDRHGRGSTITSQLPVALWHDVIGEPTRGDAILDRTTPTGSSSTALMRKLRTTEGIEPPRSPRRPLQPMASRPRE